MEISRRQPNRRIRTVSDGEEHHLETTRNTYRVASKSLTAKAASPGSEIPQGLPRQAYVYLRDLHLCRWFVSYDKSGKGASYFPFWPNRSRAYIRVGPEYFQVREVSEEKGVTFVVRIPWKEVDRKTWDKWRLYVTHRIDTGFRGKHSDQANPRTRTRTRTRPRRGHDSAG